MNATAMLRPLNTWPFPGGALLAARRPTSRRFRMGLKRLCKLTLPVFLLVGGGSAAEALTPPYALTATAVSSGQIRLSWGAFNQGQLFYPIERSLNWTGGFAQVGIAPASATSYTDSGLAPGTRYYYRVRAAENGTASAYSAIVSAITFGTFTAATSTTTSTTSTTLAGSLAPVANAGADQFTQTLITLSFNGSGSVDRGGTITSYAWRFGDGGTASGVSPTHAYATPGTYTATLTITDSRGSSASDTAVVRVVNRSPVADAGSDHSGSLGSAVTFRGSGSDQDGTVTSYTWDFGDGASAAGATPSHAYATAGTYTAKLTVTDDRGALGSDSALVTVAGSPGGTPWARGFGGAASDVGYGVAVDASGNAVMTGRVESTVDFGGGVVCPPAAVFVSKYSPTGATMWSKCLGGVLGGGTGRAVAVDGSGNVLVTGKFSGTIDFGTGALTSAGPSSIFVAKYSAAGAPVWSRAFGGGLNDVGNGVAVDSGGNVVIIGTASGTVSFGGGPITANGYTVVVAKFSPAGAHLWSRGFGDSFSNSGNGVAVDPSGNIAVTGAFSGQVNFGGGVLTSAGVDIFLAKLSPTGGHLWSRHFGSALAVHAGNGVACDGSGNVLVTGALENSIDLAAGWTTSFAHKDMFVAKYSPAGDYLWSRLAGGLFDDAGSGIAVDMSGKGVVTGTLPAAVNFGAGSLTSAGRTDIFVARYAADGTPLGAQRFGGADFDAGTAVAVDGGGRPVVTGAYRLGVDFGGTPLTAAGMDDIFLLASW